MGEIKSTLDIIMEKTKGLTMTDEEKRDLQKREVEGKVRGLVQKFMEGMRGLDRIKREMAGLGEEKRKLAREALLGECLGRIDPGRDNKPIFDVLEHVAGLRTAAFRKLLSEFHQDLEKRRNVQEAALRNRLKEKGIWGTAVITNIEADPEWVRYVSEKRTEFQSTLISLRPELDA